MSYVGTVPKASIGQQKSILATNVSHTATF